MTPEVLALGETMLSLVAVGVPLAEATELHVTIGGAESNTCVGLVRLGVSAAWVSRLGTDPAGHRVAHDLERAGVDLRWVRRDAERPTGLMLRETSGAPARYVRSGSAASMLSPADLDEAPVEDCGAVLVTGITAMLGEAPAAAALALLERARGLRVVDPNLRAGLWGSGRERELVLPLVERADIVLAGARELQALLGDADDDRALAERCAMRGAREVIVKRGAEGAGALGPDGSWLEVPGPVVEEVDPVGAGDAFNAGYLAARLRDLPIAEALERATRCGASAAAALGDIGWIGGTG